MAIVRFEHWQDLPGLIAGISTSDYGNLSYKWAPANQQTAEDIAVGRERFYRDCGVEPSQVVATQVVDGTDLIDITRSQRGLGVTKPEEGLVGDGFFTQETDTYLFVITGDCLVLFLLEPVHQVCGLVHAGYKGVDQELPRLAVEHMVARYGCRPENIQLGFSPALQKQSTVLEHFDKFKQDSLDRWSPYISGQPGRYQVNWVEFAYQQLLQAGIKPGHIENPGIDTWTDSRFYSHSRSKKQEIPEARFGCLIGFKSE